MRHTNRRILALSVVVLTATMLALALAGTKPVLAQVSTPTAGEDTVYHDPDGRFAMPIPTNWIAEERDGFVTVVTDDKKIAISLVLIPDVGASEAIARAMQQIHPDFDATPLPELMATPSSGSDDVALFTYDDGSSSGQLVQAYGQRVGNVVFVLVLEGDRETIGLRQVQVDKIRFGIQVFPDALGSPVATPAA